MTATPAPSATTTRQQQVEPLTSYSLLTQPWLLARDLDGEIRELSLVEVFEQAPNLAALVGEIPTQEIAALRLLLAILYRAIEFDHEEESPYDVWRPWWEARALPVERVRSYLDRHADRFDLLDPTQPFFQVAGLHTASGNTSGLGKIIAEIPDGEPFFTTRAGAAVTELSFGEAARWLVHCQAFDYSGIKSGAVGDERVKGGKGYPIGTGFTGALGLVAAEGRTLAETLLLNFVLTHWHAGDRVPWEHPPLGPAVDRGHPEPHGPADLATWQVRRIRLVHDGRRVTDVVIANGDPVGPQNRQTLEPMSSWRYSEPQTKKLKQTTYMPLEHPAGRALWRGLSSILAERTTQAATRSNVSAYLPAGLLSWLAGLTEHELVSQSEPIVLRTVGMAYGAQQSSIASVTDDRMSLAVGVLTDPVLRRCAVDAADAAEKAVNALGRLAANLADAAGRRLLPGESDGARDRAMTETFSVLDEPYRRWVGQLSDPAQVTGHAVAWQHLADQLLRQEGARLIRAAGQPALIGREVNGHFLNSAKAEIFFRAALRTALPHAYATQAGMETTA